MTTKTGGEWVVDALRAEGVRHVFGIPGVHNLAIYDALTRQKDSGTSAFPITHILARHEQGAAFMADGYARSSGNTGVVIVTTGPGATNALTPLAESYAGSIPVLAVMSDVSSDLLGRDLGALHEVVNQIDCFRPMTRWAETITEGAAIPRAIGGAFDLLRTGRPGPIALSVPNDLLFGKSDSDVKPGGGRRPPCHVADIAEAAKRLAGASRPLILAGGGVIASGAEQELLALARRLGAPVITTVMGRGSISERDPLWHSVMPNKHASADVFAEADVVLAVGCRFAARSTQGLLLNLSFGPHQTLIHLDLDPTVIGKLFKPQLGIVGDARDGLARLLESLGGGASHADSSRSSNARPHAAWDRAKLATLRSAAGPRYTRELAHFIETLRRAVPDDGIVVNDQTGVNYWMEWMFPVLAPRTFLYPVGSATLGYAVPAAIGAQIANPGKPVVAVVGDGGFMFSVNELATAVKYRLPLVFLLMNDERYGAIKWLQEKMFQGRWSEVDLANPDFIALARAFGANGERLRDVDALPAAIAKALRAGGPSVLELHFELEPPWDV